MIDARAMQMVQSPTAAREAMAMQQNLNNLSLCRDICMAQMLWEDEKAGNADALKLRARAKQILQAYLDGLEQEAAT